MRLTADNALITYRSRVSFADIARRVRLSRHLQPQHVRRTCRSARSGDHGHHTSCEQQAPRDEFLFGISQHLLDRSGGHTTHRQHTPVQIQAITNMLPVREGIHGRVGSRFRNQAGCGAACRTQPACLKRRRASRNRRQYRRNQTAALCCVASLKAEPFRIFLALSACLSLLVSAQ